MNHVTDLDLENRSSWQGALDMVFALCGEAADLSFDCRMLGEDKTPTVEIRLDNPAELALPRTAEADGATVETWKYGTVVLAEERPAKLPEGLVFLLRRGGAGLGLGLTALLYFAGLIINLNARLDGLRFFTPYFYADAARLLSGEPVAGALAAGCAWAVLGAGFGLWQFRRKDIA